MTNQKNMKPIYSVTSPTVSWSQKYDYTCIHGISNIMPYSKIKDQDLLVSMWLQMSAGLWQRATLLQRQNEEKKICINLSMAEIYKDCVTSSCLLHGPTENLYSLHFMSFQKEWLVCVSLGDTNKKKNMASASLNIRSGQIALIGELPNNSITSQETKGFYMKAERQNIRFS